MRRWLFETLYEIASIPFGADRKVLYGANGSRGSKPEGGFTIGSALVMISVIGLVIFGFLKSQSYTLQIQNLVKSKRAVQDVKTAFEGAIIEQFQGVAPSGPCFVPATQFRPIGTGSGGFNLSGLAKMGFQNQVLSGLNLQTVMPPTMRAKLSEAKARCQMPRVGTNLPGRYFCVDFAKSTSTPAGSFVSGNKAFAEIYIESRDLTTGAPILCGNVNTATGGAWVLYSAYWPAVTADGVMWQQLTGGFNASAR